MPQILDAFVCFASMMQRYEFFSKLPNFLAIIFDFFLGQVTHLPTYPVMTGRFPEKVDYKFYNYILL